MKLNLGCGTRPLEGFVNLDLAPGDRVDVVHDLDDVPWPFPDDSADFILASHVLEHVIHFDRSWSEIHRILKPGAQVEVHVPYKVNFDPYHIRYFSRASVFRLASYTSEHPSPCGGEDQHFRVVSVKVGGFPSPKTWPWYFKTYVLGFGILPDFSRELQFVLQKLEAVQ